MAGPITLITGIMASGKSSVAQALAERLPHGVHVRGDSFRRMVVNGRAEMTLGGPPEALEQLWLRYRLAAQTALAYAEAGFDVVVQDVILGPVLSEVLALYGDHPLRLVVLCPSPEVVAQREAGRGKRGYGAWTPFDLDRALREETPRLGFWLDSSALSLDQSVRAIQEHFGPTS